MINTENHLTVFAEVHLAKMLNYGWARGQVNDDVVRGEDLTVLEPAGVGTKTHMTLICRRDCQSS